MEYFKSLTDNQVPAEYKDELKKFRDYATKIGVKKTVSVCVKVEAGFTLKKHAPLMGNCCENFKYLQDWDFEDEPTQDSCVFWIPKLIPESFNKTVDEQKELLKSLGFSNSFGSVALLVGLILHHFEETGERIPEELNFIRTCSRLRGGGFRVGLGYFCSGGLRCGYWGWVDAFSNVGCLAFKVNLNDSKTEPTEIPTGVFAWKNEGIKWGFDKYFGITWK